MKPLVAISDYNPVNRKSCLLWNFKGDVVCNSPWTCQIHLVCWQMGRNPYHVVSILWLRSSVRSKTDDRITLQAQLYFKSPLMSETCPKCHLHNSNLTLNTVISSANLNIVAIFSWNAHLIGDPYASFASHSLSQKCAASGDF